MASLFKKNVDSQANQNNKFLHFAGSTQLSELDFHSCDVHRSVYLQGASLENGENSKGMHRGLPLFFPLKGSKCFAELASYSSPSYFRYFTYKRYFS